MFELFQRLPTNVIRIFSGRNLLAHAAAIVLTVCLVHFGVDWWYYRGTRSEMVAQLALPGIMLGSAVPIFGTLAVLILGWLSRSRRLLLAGWGLGQAAILGSLISISYKAWTGRIPPPFRGFPMSAQHANSLTDTSHGFQLGFLKGGIFWGWPSSHTTIAFAMSGCLVTLFPKQKLMAALALSYAFYVGLAVSVSMHWVSEFVAGAIIGSVIGRVVGSSFRARLP